MTKGDKGKLFSLFVPLFTLSSYSARLCAPCAQTRNNSGDNEISGTRSSYMNIFWLQFPYSKTSESSIVFSLSFGTQVGICHRYRSKLENPTRMWTIWRIVSALVRCLRIYIEKKNKQKNMWFLDNYQRFFFIACRQFLGGYRKL